MTNLELNSNYEFRGRIRPDENEKAVVEVSGYNVINDTIISDTVTGISTPKWADIRIRFKTSTSDTTAKIFAEKTSSGSERVYADDFSVIYIQKIL